MTPRKCINNLRHRAKTAGFMILCTAHKDCSGRTKEEGCVLCERDRLYVEVGRLKGLLQENAKAAKACGFIHIGTDLKCELIPGHVGKHLADNAPFGDVWWHTYEGENLPHHSCVDFGQRIGSFCCKLCGKLPELR